MYEYMRYVYTCVCRYMCICKCMYLCCIVTYKRKSNQTTRVELLVSHRAPPQVADRGRLTRYGGYWGNKISRVDQNQLHCLVEKGHLQMLGEKNPRQKISLLRVLDGDRGGTVVKVLCYKSEGRWFDSRWCHWNFSLT